MPTALTLTVALALLVPGVALGATTECGNADARPGTASEAALSSATVCLVNRERGLRDMGPLRRNGRLSRAAVAHTRDMIKRSYFEHESPAGQNVVDRLLSTGYLGKVRSWLVGENLAWGTGTRSTPREIVTSWMASPGHRRNILNRRFREIGIGVVFSAPGQAGAVAATYTTTFGYRRSR